MRAAAGAGQESGRKIWAYERNFGGLLEAQRRKEGGEMREPDRRFEEQMCADSAQVFEYMKDFDTHKLVLPAMRKNARRYKNPMLYLNYAAALLQQYFGEDSFAVRNRALDWLGVAETFYWLGKTRKLLDAETRYPWCALMADACAVCFQYKRAIAWYTAALQLRDSYEVRYNRAICLSKINAAQAADALLELLEAIDLEKSIENWQIDLREKLKTTFDFPLPIIAYVELFWWGRFEEASVLARKLKRFGAAEIPYSHIVFILERDPSALKKCLKDIMRFEMDEEGVRLREMIRRAKWLDPQTRKKWLAQLKSCCIRDLGKMNFYVGAAKSRFLRKRLYIPKLHIAMFSHREDRYMDLPGGESSEPRPG